MSWLTILFPQSLVPLGLQPDMLGCELVEDTSCRQTTTELGKFDEENNYSKRFLWREGSNNKLNKKVSCFRVSTFEGFNLSNIEKIQSFPSLSFHSPYNQLKENMIKIGRNVLFMNKS